MVPYQWLEHFRNWESSRVSLVLAKQTTKGKGGRPPEDRTGEIQAEWTKLDKPRITAADCDKIGKQFFAAELNGFQPGSKEHKRVRERVRRAIIRGNGRLQHN